MLTLFLACAQTCIMGSRVLVHERIYERFVAALVAKVSAIRCGDPSDASTQMGPLISAAQRDKVERFVQLAKDEGARVLCGGRRPEMPLALRAGFFYEPTLIGNVTPQVSQYLFLMREHS